MKRVTFITGNKNKAEYLAEYLGFPVEHIKLDLDEIQSLDLKEVVRHKVRQAYKEVEGPVLVEDVSLRFTALGQLPGTFIKWFLDELGLEGLCRLIDGKDRTAVASCVFGYFDGETEKYFEGSLNGTVAQNPTGDGGFGWDQIFIPEGYDVTRAELSKEDDAKTYLQIKPFEALKTYLASLPD
jgi:inosine triphosphate pyrophosphatase